MGLNQKDIDAIKYLRALKRLTSSQKQIVDLANVSTRSHEQEHLLRTLLRAHHARVTAERVSARLTAKIAAQEESGKIATTATSERQRRNKRLVQHGLLIEAAQLAERSDAELTGALQDLATADSQQWQLWADKGARIMAEREMTAAARKAARKEAAEAARRAAAEAYQAAKEEALRAAEQAALTVAKQ